MRWLRRLRHGDSGEVLTVIAVTTTIATLILGTVQAKSAQFNAEDIHAATETMRLAADAQQETLEGSPGLQAKMSDEERARLYARWDGMRRFAKETNRAAQLDSIMAQVEIIADAGLTVVAPVTKGSKLIQAADAVFEAKDPFDVIGAVQDNAAEQSPEMFAYTKQMIERIDGRTSAEEFMIPVRETYAENKIADMMADTAHANSVGGGAPVGVVRQRMARTIARSYTQLKTGGEVSAEDGGYDRFVREQVRSTHPREAGGVAAGEIIADERAKRFFDDGACDTIIAMVQTEDGGVLVELKRGEDGNVTAISMAAPIQRTVLGDVPQAVPADEVPPEDAPPATEGEVPAAPEAEQPPATDDAAVQVAQHAGVYTGEVGVALTTGKTQVMPARMEVAEDGSFTFTMNYSGSGSGWGQDWMSGLKWRTEISGRVAANGTTRGQGTRTTIAIAADGNSPPPNTTSASLAGTVSGDGFNGTLRMANWQSRMPSVKLQRR